MGEVEVEGLILAAGDEVNGLLGIELDQAALPFPVHQFRNLFVPEDRYDRDLGLGALLEHVVRIGDAVIVVKTLPGGQEFRLVAQVPLPDHLGGIAFFFKSFCYSYFRRIKPHGLAREIDSRNGDAGAIAAGHHLGPGDRADRGGVEAGQFHALLGHPVEMGGALLGRPERPDVPISHIIDEDHHHVGRAGGGGGRKQGGQQDEKRLHGVPLEQSPRALVASLRPETLFTLPTPIRSDKNAIFAPSRLLPMGVTLTCGERPWSNPISATTARWRARSS